MANSTFILEDDQQAKLDEWRKIQDHKVAERQKGTDQERKGGSNYGCCGGAYTYSFTPSTIGTFVHVRNEVTGESIDLTGDL